MFRKPGKDGNEMAHRKAFVSTFSIHIFEKLYIYIQTDGLKCHPWNFLKQQFCPETHSFPLCKLLCPCVNPDRLTALVYILTYWHQQCKSWPIDTNSVNPVFYWFLLSQSGNYHISKKFLHHIHAWKDNLLFQQFPVSMGID